MPRETGFVLPSAIFLLVVLGGLAAWLTSLTQASQAQTVLALEGERAYQAAQAGLESAMYEVAVLHACTARDIDLTGQLDRFVASVRCTPYSANEGGATVDLYAIVSVACNQPAAGACPNPNPVSSEYAERQVRAVMGGD
jgi:MSHA biogenesis protein MshP